MAGVQHHEIVWHQDEMEKELERHGFQVLESGVSDLLPDGWFGLQPLMNRLEPLTRSLERKLLSTPLKRFANNMTIITAKP